MCKFVLKSAVGSDPLRILNLLTGVGMFDSAKAAPCTRAAIPIQPCSCHRHEIPTCSLQNQRPPKLSLLLALYSCLSNNLSCFSSWRPIWLTSLCQSHTGRSCLSHHGGHFPLHSQKHSLLPGFPIRPRHQLLIIPLFVFSGA